MKATEENNKNRKKNWAKKKFEQKKNWAENPFQQKPFFVFQPVDCVDYKREIGEESLSQLLL